MFLAPATGIACRAAASPFATGPPKNFAATISATSGIWSSAEETRTLADFRRCGAQEASAADALPADVSHAMGNTVSTSNMLFATSNPVNMASVRKVHEARIRGRRRLREGGKTTRPALTGKAEGGTE